MLIKLIVSIVLLAGPGCYSRPEVNLNDLLSDIFSDSNISPASSTTRPYPTREVQPAGYGPKSCDDGRECVQHFLCKNGTVVQDGKGVIDIRSGGEKGKCDYLEVCCLTSDKVPSPIYPIRKYENKGCGFRNADGVGFKITGDEHNEAEFGEFPWMAAILEVEDNLSIYQCGASVITPSVLLTAAHCVKTKHEDKLRVRAGEWDTQSQQEILPHQERQVINKLIHEGYDSGSLINDVALVFIDLPFELADNVQPICLPPAGMSFDYSRCYATGWGKSEFGRDGKYQVILKKIDLPIVPREQCQANLRLTRLGRHFQLDKSFICAGGELGKDTCKGDGGSPLVCPIANTRNQFYQAGIVAWGVGCGELNVPGVYASVSYLKSWIDDKLQSWDVDTHYYSPI